MPLKVLIVPAATSQPIRVDGISGDLESMQRLVGGSIESCPVPVSDITIWCNENGKIGGLRVNSRATWFWQHIWNEPIDDYLVGDVFITGGVDAEGNTLSVPDHAMQTMEETLKRL